MSIFSSLRYFADSKDYSSSDDEKSATPKIEKQEKKIQLNRLNELLTSMRTDDNLTLVKNVQIAKPSIDKRKKKIAKTTETETDNLRNAIKNVSIAAGSPIVESELLSKLLGGNGENRKVDKTPVLNLK